MIMMMTQYVINFNRKKGEDELPDDDEEDDGNGDDGGNDNTNVNRSNPNLDLGNNQNDN